MSHPKGGEGAFNYVVTALSKVLAVCITVRLPYVEVLIQYKK